MRGSIRAAIALTIAIRAAGSAFAQGGAHQQASQVPRYVPASPTVSPYVNLLNRNGGAASNYYGLIRPLQRQAAINAAQTQSAAVEEQQIRNVKDQQESFEQPTVKPTGTAGWFQNAGTAATYQDPSHYYGQWPSAKNKRKTGR
jgi:hypothetical protein